MVAHNAATVAMVPIELRTSMVVLLMVDHAPNST